MGQAATSAQEEDGAEQGEAFDEEEVRRTFKNLNDDNLSKKVPEAFRAAYADDPKALDQLESLVREIEQGGKDKVDEASKEKAQAEKQRAQTAERRTAKAADWKAERWLKDQLRLHEEKKKAQGKKKETESKDCKKKTSPDALPEQHTPGNSVAASSTPVRTHPHRSDNQVVDSPRYAHSLSCLPSPQQPVAGLLEDCPAAPPVPALPQPVPELYALLGVTVDATFEEIKRGYRKQALRWHPDKNQAKGSEFEAKALDQFRRIGEAFDVLFDPERRSEYDSGQVRLPGKAKRLQGHGWAAVGDEEDAALTPQAVKLKKQSWAEHVYFGGRVGDVDPVYEENNPRTPQEKIRVFWRRIGEAAYNARESAEGHADDWLGRFLSQTWKDTPSRWPSGLELRDMSETSQAEWKERRMVYNRRKMKIKIHLEAHEVYLAIPDLEEKQKARLEKIWPGRIQK